jgi:hypothetical protein
MAYAFTLCVICFLSESIGNWLDKKGLKVEGAYQAIDMG